MPTTFKILMTGLDEVERILEAMSQEERRANFILKHAEQYGRNELFKFMVDYTSYFTPDERADSYRYLASNCLTSAQSRCLRENY